MELEINNRKKKKLGKYINTWKLNNMLLNSQWVFKKKEITRENREYFKINEYENTTYRNLRNITKVVLIGKCIAVKDVIFFLKRKTSNQ